MQTGAKKIITLATVAFITVGAYLCANLFTRYVAGKLEVGGREEVRAGAEGVRPQVASRLADYDVIAERNLFNDNPRPPAELAAAAQPATPAAPAEPPKPEPLKLNAALVATAVRSQGASFAVFQEGNVSSIVFAGDPVSPGITLKEIGKDYVLVMRNGSEEKIELFAARPVSAESAQRGPMRPPTRTRPATPPVPGRESAVLTPQSDTIRQVSENAWAIDRSEFDNAIANMTALMQQIRVVPNVTGTGDSVQTDGFKVFSIVPASLFSRIGLQNNDIIKEVNGTPLNSIEQAYEAFSRLQGESSIQLNLLRKGQPLTLAYDVR
ncbi:PDZ domain-containing protein [bacterium]|nr:MAG: PDZ domain-containing protein [bacterium]